MPDKHTVHAPTSHTLLGSTQPGGGVCMDADLNLPVQGKSSKLMSPRGLRSKYEIEISEEEIQALRIEMWVGIYGLVR